MNTDVVLVTISVISFLTYFTLKTLIFYAGSIGLIDLPNERSSHETPTPRGAGIGIFFSIVIYGILIGDINILLSHWYFILATSTIFVLGLYDDVVGASSNVKFYAITVAAVFLYMYGLRIDFLGTYFGESIELVPFLSFFVTIFAVVGFTNALNLIDGLDGLSGLVSLVVLSALWYIGYTNHDTFIITVTSLVIPSLIIFILFNWNPARIFLGDSGSLTLGFLIAALCIKALSYIDPVSILYIAALPIMDTIIVMVRRKINGSSAFLPDKTHIHHIVLTRTGGRVKATVIFLGIVQLVYTYVGLFVTANLSQDITLNLFIMNIIIVYAMLNRSLHSSKVKSNELNESKPKSMTL